MEAAVRLATLSLVLAMTVGASGCLSPAGPLRDTAPVYTSAGTIGSRGAGNGQFNYPVGLGIDPNGGLFVADSYNRRIERFALDGTFLSAWPAVGSMDGTVVDYPGDVGIDRRRGLVYLSYRYAHRIILYNRDGYAMLTWGSHGSAAGQFDQPLGVVVDDSGFVYVADYNNSRIQKFTSNGAFVTMWGQTPVPPDYHLWGPSVLALDHRGRLYVIDGMHNQVVVYRTDGTFVRTIGELGSGEGQFRGPIGLSVDERNWLYTTDTELGRVQIFDEEGSFVTMWNAGGPGSSSSGALRGIVAADDGRVYVSEYALNQLHVYAPLPGLRGPMAAR
jgi:tripartite motif-containing protein 71